jgi:putative transposase
MSQRHPVQNDVVMLITTNVRNRMPLFRNDAYAREAIDSLYRVQKMYLFSIHAFVVMPDHVHLLLFVPAPGCISSIIRSYKRAVSHAIGCGPLWQPRFHVRIVDNSSDARNYIHQNPLRAGLTENPETYSWSSASGQWDVQELRWW